MPKHRLTETELANWLFEMRQAYACGQPTPPKQVTAYYHQAAVLEFPLGEVTNRALAGFLFVWYHQNKIKIQPITQKDRFDAQGLEGKCVVETTLWTALVAADALPQYRRAVYMRFFEQIEGVELPPRRSKRPSNSMIQKTEV